MNNIVVLGAGIAGISASMALKNLGVKSIVFEKEDTWGGLCNSFEIDGFTFDTFVHLAFSNDENVNNIFEKGVTVIKHENNPSNYHKGKFLKHPVQNNLFKLEIEEKIEIIEDFVKKDDQGAVTNYQDWLYFQYGKCFSEMFPIRYTRKYWTVEAYELETDWISVRMNKPTFRELLYGALTDNTPNYTYAPKLRYPSSGGFKAFLNNMVSNIDIVCNKRVIEVNLESKTVYFEDNTLINYDKLISTIPLTEICELISEIPPEIKEASDNLEYTSGALISLGFNSPHIGEKLMFYVYDEDVLPARIYSPSIKSPQNAPLNCSSLQAEIYFSKKKPLKGSLDEVLEETINQMINMNLFEIDDLIVKDIRKLEYANVIFKPSIYDNRKKIQDYLRDNEIIPAGRFGDWDYLWSDQSFNSGKRAAEELVDSK